MTRAEQVAAAIERLNLMESDWRETRLWEVAVELARLLREAQPEPATPAPEVPEVIQTWCKNYDATEDCGGLDWARNSRLRDYYRKEYPDACK